MDESRRFFMKSFSIGAAALATADGLVAKAGGDLNVAPVRNAEIDAARARLKDHFTVEPALSSYVEVRDHVLYDSLRVPSGVEVPPLHHFLSQPVGWYARGSWDQKSFADTNMVLGNQLPPPQEFYVERILFLLSDMMVPQDRDRLAMSYFFELMLMDKVVARAPLARCPVTGELASIVEFKNEGGSVMRRGVRRNVTIDSPYCLHLTRPIHFPSLCQFGFTLAGRPFKPVGNIEMFAMLDGVGVFAVQ
jgi:hypothetical protein